MTNTLAPMSDGTATAGDDTFAAAIQAAQDEIARGVERGGLRDDPYRYPLAALSTVLGLFPEFLQRMRETAEEARQPLDAAALERLETAAAGGAARYASDLVKTQARRTALMAGAVLAGSVLLSSAIVGVSCYRWGRGSAIADIQETESGFAAAFRDGPDAAAGWLRLMRLNDLPRVLALCANGKGFTDPSGRRACQAPLWLDAPQPAAPPSIAGR